MSALDTLRAARAAGIQLSLDGNDLVMEAPAPPPPAVVAALKQNKAEIVTLLRVAMRPQGCPDDEWLAAVVDAARLSYGLLIPKQGRQC